MRFGVFLRASSVVALFAAAAAARPQSAPESSADPTLAERLRALPYSGWARSDGGDATGVTRYVRGSAFEGMNLFPLTSRSEAWLMDMEGHRLHTWASDRGRPEAEQNLPSFMHGWQDVTVDGEGSLYALVSRDRLLKLGADSRLLWERPLRAHHAVSLGPGGSVYTLTDELRVVDAGGGPRRVILDNDVVCVDAASGQVRSRLSLYDVLSTDAVLLARLRVEAARRLADAAAAGHGRGLASSRQREVERALAGTLPDHVDRELLALLNTVPFSPFDLLHANSVRVLDEPVEGLGRRGDLLVSIRDLDLVAVVDPERRRLRWSWGPGVIERQHDASIASNGNLLVFDNRPRRAASRVVEMVPASGRIVWSHDGFFSATRGGAQPLPNGNVLIVESDAARAFEVTRSGATVWEFHDPDEVGARGLTLREMKRLGGEDAARLRRSLGL